MRGILLALSALLVAVLSAQRVDSAADSVRDALKERYRLSRLDLVIQPSEGRIATPGAVLRLEVDGVPAKRFRVTQINSKSPRFHVRDYARVELGGERMTAEPAELTLGRGTRLLVLDLKVEPDRVRLFTHTLEPVAASEGRPAYGCTEFVFRLAPNALAGGPPDAVFRAIERWLTVERGPARSSLDGSAKLSADRPGAGQ